MSIYTYLAERVPWAVVGLLAGYLLGRGIRVLERIDTADSSEESTVEQRSRGARLRKITGNHVLGAVVFLLAFGTVVQGYIQNEQTKRVGECTRAYSNGFADAIDARSQASSEEREALVQWMRTLDELITKAPLGGDPAEGRRKFGQATSEYLKKQADLKQKQQENPFPAPPRDVCK